MNVDLVLEGGAKGITPLGWDFDAYVERYRSPA